MIRILCPGCQQPLRIPDEQAGATVRCPKCQAVMRVPTAPAPAAPAPPPPPPVPPPLPPEFIAARTRPVDPGPPEELPELQEVSPQEEVPTVLPVDEERDRDRDTERGGYSRPISALLGPA